MLLFVNKQLRYKGKKPLVCSPVHPNVGLKQIYQNKLDNAIQQLHNSIIYWLKAEWHKDIKLANDATSAQNMRDLFRKMGRRWEKNFDELAPELAKYFAQKSEKRVSASLQRMLKDKGMTVDFVMSRFVREAYHAVIGENVGLIKSIAKEHLAKVEQEVMRSVAVGRDLATLTQTLEKQYNLTRRRAALISRDQNNKATSIITRARQLELGITQAKWRHSRGGRVPRPSHVKADKDGVIYDVAKGWFDPDEQKWIHPGMLINCRCVSVPIIAGFES